jgi:outer membrane receptor for ferrienterochelin and colicins
VTIAPSEAPGDLIVQYDPQRVRQYQNMEDAKTYGLDFTARYQARHFTFGGSYSYLDTQANQYDSEKEVMHRVTIDGMAHHKANWYATWTKTLSQPLSGREGGKMFQPVSKGIGIYGRLSSKRYYQIDGDGKGYQLWRLTAHYRFNVTPPRHPRVGLGVGLDFGIDNIFNYVDRTPHGLHLGTTTPGRTVYASLVVRFNQGKKITNQYKSNFNSNENEND